MMTLTGNIIGALAIIFFFWSYQVKDKAKLIFVQSGATLLTCIQYLLVGGYSGFALNIVCLIRNVFFFLMDKKQAKSPLIPIIFACILPIVSIFSWDGWISLFVIGGLTINTLCLGLGTAQDVRKSILLTSPMVIVYNIATQAYAGIVNETIVIISAVIGLIRFAKSRSN